MNALEAAREIGAKSVSFPAICYGNDKSKNYQCARIMLKNIANWLTLNLFNDCPVVDVRIVEPESSTVRAFKRIMLRRYIEYEKVQIGRYGEDLRTKRGRKVNETANKIRIISWDNMEMKFNETRNEEIINHVIKQYKHNVTEGIHESWQGM